jgi:signal peptidase
MPSWFPGTSLAGPWPRRALTIAGWSCVGIVLTIVVLLAFPVALSLFGYHPYIIYGGSMGSSLPAGSIGLTETVDSESLKVGDIIAVKRAGRASPILHRVVNIESDGEGGLYFTQGDKNGSPDPDPVRLEGTGDRVAFAIPYLGYLVHFARGSWGRVLLLFLPSSLLLASVLSPRSRLEPRRVFPVGGEPEC